VRKRWPPIKIVMVSGVVRPQPYELPSNSYFFEKPYQPAAMVAKLRSLIGLNCILNSVVAAARGTDAMISFAQICQK